MNFERLTTPQRISGAAIIVVALAAFLPWVSILGVSAAGIQGDGVLTLLLAAAGAAVLGYSTGLVGGDRSPGRASQLGLLVLAAVVALIGLVDLNEFSALGLYLTLLGGIVWTAGAAWQLALMRSGSAADVP